MSEFKVGDRVRIITNGFEGEIFNVESRLMTSSNRLIEGCFIDFYDLTDKYRTICGLQAGELELIERVVEKEKYKTPEQLKIEELEKRIEKLEKCVMGEQNSLEKSENVSTMSKNGLLTEDERVILKKLDKKWKWIGRDEVDCLRIFKDKPYREKGYWRSLENYEFLDIFNHLFCFIGLKDEEPYNIGELLKGECGNDN